MSPLHASIRGAKRGAIAGLALAVGIALISAVAMLIFAIAAESRTDGGAVQFVERLAKEKSPLDIVWGFAVAVASFAFWGAVLGALVLTPTRASGH
jgi:hypothetical protein